MTTKNYPILKTEGPGVFRSGRGPVPDEYHVLHYTNTIPHAARSLAQGQLVRLQHDHGPLAQVRAVLDQGRAVFLGPLPDVVSSGRTAS